MFNINQLASFAFKNNCSYFGGKQLNQVLTGHQGELVFFFNPKHVNNNFFMWVRQNFNSSEYRETYLIFRHQSWAVIFLKVPQIIESKFLFNFKKFIKKSKHLVNYF